MSDHQTDQKHEPEHHTFIHTPRQLIIVVTLAFVIPVIVIFMLAAYVTTGARGGAGGGLSEQATLERIRPVAGFELRDASVPREMASGEHVYNTQCAACHTSGAAGAPKLGDKGDWSARLKQGFDALVTASLKGKGAMPPQAGGEFSEFEIARAVHFMTAKVGGDFPEPQQQAAKGEAKADAPQQAQQPQQAQVVMPQAGAVITAPQAAVAPDVAPAAAGTLPKADQPVPATPAIAAVPGAAMPGGGEGKAIYDSACAVCHTAGVAGAPKLGDASAWAPRIESGIDAMLASVIKGKGAMPPKGGKPDATEDQLRAAVDYMVANSK